MPLAKRWNHCRKSWLSDDCGLIPHFGLATAPWSRIDSCSSPMPLSAGCLGTFSVRKCRALRSATSSSGGMSGASAGRRSAGMAKYVNVSDPIENAVDRLTPSAERMATAPGMVDVVPCIGRGAGSNAEAIASWMTQEGTNCVKIAICCRTQAWTSAAGKQDRVLTVTPPRTEQVARSRGGEVKGVTRGDITGWSWHSGKAEPVRAAEIVRGKVLSVLTEVGSLELKRLFLAPHPNHSA